MKYFAKIFVVLGMLFVAGMMGSPKWVWSQITETPFASFEAPVGLDIPDANEEGITSVISVPGSAPLRALEVAVQIEHPSVRQLVISLTGPNGATVLLHNRTEHDGTLFHPIYDSMTEPVEALSPFLGKDAQGDWTLQVIDQSQNLTGRLIAWGMRMLPVDLTQQPQEPLLVQPGSYVELQRFLTDGPVSGTQKGDVNGDGIDDLLLLSREQNQVMIHLANSTGLNTPSLTVDVDDPQKAIITDLNDDFLTDMVVGSQDEAFSVSTISVFLGNEAGALAPFFTTEVQTLLKHMDVLDYDGDGIEDIILGGKPHWLPGVGDGSFDPPQELIPGLGRQLFATGDMDEDGIKDLLLTISRGGTSPNADPHVILNKGEPQDDLRFKFSFEENVIPGFLQGELARIDNSDANEFVMLSDTGETDPTYWFTRVRRTSQGEFFSQTSRLPGDAIGVPFEAFDLNGDLFSDFVYGATEGVKVFQKTSEPSGGTTTDFFVFDRTEFAEPGFYFDNGLPGVAVVDALDNVILLQAVPGTVITPTPTMTPTPTPTTIVFPTVFPSPTPTISINPTPSPSPTLVPGEPSSPDLNGDGIVDQKDLLILMQHWGEQIQN